MIGSALVLVAQALGIILFSALTIVLVWAVCGFVFCVLTSGVSCGCCNLCEAVRRWRRRHGHGVA